MLGSRRAFAGVATAPLEPKRRVAYGNLQGWLLVWAHSLQQLRNADPPAFLQLPDVPAVVRRTYRGLGGFSPRVPDLRWPGRRSRLLPFVRSEPQRVLPEVREL